MQATSSMPSASRASAFAVIAWIALCQAAGAVGALATDPALYRTLERPSWAPPGWLFGPVWLSLYTAMGVAGWRLWRAPRTAARRAALTWFAIQLGLNALWTPVFFGLEAVGAALVVIVLLAGAIAITIARAARLSRLAAALLVPYLAWVGFATALNAALWTLNR